MAGQGLDRTKPPRRLLTSLPAVMAERALYHNDSEPPFPFDDIVPSLDWLPSSIASYQDPDKASWNGELVAIIDTVLVFAREPRVSMQ